MTTTEIKRLDLEVPANNLNLKEIRVFPGDYLQVSLAFQFGMDDSQKLIVKGFANPTNPEMPGAENDPLYFLSLARVRRMVDGQWQSVSTATLRGNAKRALNAIFSNAYLAATMEDAPVFEVPEVQPLENRSAAQNDLGIVAIVPHLDIAPTGQVYKTGQAYPCTVVFQNHLSVEVVMRPGSNGYYLDYYPRRLNVANTKGQHSADNVYWLDPTKARPVIIGMVRHVFFPKNARPVQAQAQKQAVLPEILTVPNTHADGQFAGYENDELPF